MADILDRLTASLSPGGLIRGPEVPADRLSDWHVTAPAGTRPLALVRPASTAEVSAILAICHATATPVVPQGGRTGLAGGAVAIDGAVLLSLERMRAIEEVDVAAGTMTVEAGVPLQAAQEAADAAGLLFPLDIGARGTCTIGGNIATNAGGNRVLRYGMMRALVMGLEVVLADGTVLTDLNKMLKNNTAYDLKQLFVGSEGTLGVITRAVLRLFPKPLTQTTALCGVADFAGVHALLARVRGALASDLAAFEVMWPSFYEPAVAGRQAPLGPGHAAYVLVEAMGADPENDAERFAAVIGAALEAGEIADAVIARSLAESARLWAIRDMSGELTRHFMPNAAFDVSVATGAIDAFVRDVEQRCRARWADAEVIAFGHLADSNVHLMIRVGERPLPHDAIDAMVYGCVRDWRGSVSAEHGIGLLKKRYLGHSRTAAELATMRAVKRTLDPGGILNPGKVLDV